MRRKYDYEPIRLTESEYKTLRGIEESAKITNSNLVVYYLYKWDINVICSSSDEIGYCYQYRKLLKWWFYILTWIPGALCRFVIALFYFGLFNFEPYQRVLATYEIKNRGESCYSDELETKEFERIDDFWEQREQEATE